MGQCLAFKMQVVAAGSDMRGQWKGLFLRGMNAQQFVSNDRPIFLA